ncbi:Uncharacterised protein [Mycobacteroides abscessus subsp. abscessus]|nr:Uncharacterised protein [Mycobacteroides abscessus subsp. abscessus]SKV20500.1 Uncharacterised protein [Mycobacteroides abscessus subsp. abscessus]
MKSAGPKTSERMRGLADAIASILVSPSAFSIWAWIPMAPTRSPCDRSSWVSSRSRAVTCEAAVTLGSRMLSMLAPARETISTRSA